MTRPASRLDETYSPAEHHDVKAIREYIGDLGRPMFYAECHCGWLGGSYRLISNARSSWHDHRDEEPIP